jgi:hypothetical protein
VPLERPLTVLEETLGDAHGLAIAAASVTALVEERVHEVDLRGELRTMRAEAKETRARCLDVESELGPEAAVAILAHANTVSERAGDLAAAYFRAGTGPLAAWRFLAMGEAAEVAAWSALGELAQRSGADAVAELAGWALPVQQQHLDAALRGAVRLAEFADPAAPRFG